jgi:hypothetical protein
MHTIQKYTAGILALVQSILIICYLAITYYFFRYPFSFNFETDQNGQYFPLLVSLSGLWIGAILQTFRKEKRYVLTGLFTLLLLATISFSNQYSFSNEYIINIATVIFTLSFLISLSVSLLNTIPLIILLFFFWQLGLAFLQFSWNSDNPLRLQGSLQNSGVFSCYLIVHLPLLFYLFFLSSKTLLPFAGRRIRIFAFTILCGFILLILYKTRSRTASVALPVIVIAMYLFYSEKKFFRLPGKKKGIICLLLTTIAGISLYFLFNLKRLSAIGRVMKWDITFNHWGDYFWEGTGFGRFSWYYPQWQADYFAHHPLPPLDYFLSAGESYIIFNEYLQLFATIGIIGFSGIVVIMIWFFSTASQEHRALLQTVKLTMIAILACSFTAYPLHVNVLLLMMIFCFAVAIVVKDDQPASWFSRSSAYRAIHYLVLFLCLIIAPFTTFRCYQQYAAVGQWETLRYSPLKFNESVNRWTALYPLLQNDGKFLTEYGTFLLSDSLHYQQSSEILKRARRFFISRKTIESSARACEAVKNYPGAIEHCTWLSNYLPNLFTPKMELVNLYKKNGEPGNMARMANILLSIPVKIQSEEVERIRKEATDLLNAHKKVSSE